MAEQFLDAAEVGAFFQEVGAESVAKGVGVDVGGEAALDGDAFYDAGDGSRREAPGTAQVEVEQERFGLGIGFALGGVEAGLALVEIGAKGVGGGVGEGHVALLLAFAADQDGFVGPVNVGEVDGGEFGVAHAAAIQKLKNHGVAGGPGGDGFFRIETVVLARAGLIAIADGVDDLIHLLDGGDAGEVLREFRGGNQRGDVLVDVVESRQPFEPAADGGEGACRGGFGEASFIKRAEPGANVEVFNGGRIEGGAMGVGEPGDEGAEFAVVGAEGMGGTGALVSQGGEVLGHQHVQNAGGGGGCVVLCGG